MHTIQAVVQDVRTKQILRMGFVNDEAIAKMEAEKVVYLLNGDQSALELITGGEYFKPVAVDSLVYNVEKTAVIIKALPEGSTTGADTFRGDKNIEDLAFLSYLQDFIEKRKREMPEGSYTTKLSTQGVNKIRLQVKLAKDSPAAQMQLGFLDAEGRTVGDERWTVKKSRKATLKVPQGAVKALLSAGRATGSDPAAFEVFTIGAIH